jgi:serine/threonine-protein kinase
LSAPIDFGEGQEPISPALETGTVVGGRFRIERLIGRGGMCGGVYEAFDLGLKIRVALKTDADPQEFLTARTVTHPNVCRVFDYLDSRDLIMELLEGETLEQRLKRQGPLTAPEMESLVRQLSAGLTAAHAAGVLHRDLKPANVFLTVTGRVVLTDFGLAQISRAACATSRQFIGTLPYMAPELFAGRSASTASDIFSLGVVLFEACTGKLPFEGGVVPTCWRQLIASCMQVDPSKRRIKYEPTRTRGILPFWRPRNSNDCSTIAKLTNQALGSVFAAILAGISGVM